MDCFGLGGILIEEERIGEVMRAHGEFCASWGIDYPLHSHAIRGGRQKFSWLKNPEKAVAFLPALNAFLVALPVIGIAAVIHRPGYVARYAEKYKGSPWQMDKTAFCILMERSAKFAHSRNRTLRVFFEESGKAEDRKIVSLMREIKRAGMPFDAARAAIYDGLSAADFRAIILGDPQRRSKKTPMIQIADLYLYAIAKGGYQSDYPPFAALMEGGRLIETHVDPARRDALGTKYSCFDTIKNLGSGFPDPKRPA